MEDTKRRKFGYDEDGDHLADKFERESGMHDPDTNKPRHFMIGEHLPKPHNNIIAIYHDHLKTVHKSGSTGKMCLTMREPKKMQLCLSLNQPNLDGFNLSKIKKINTTLDIKLKNHHKHQICDDKIHNPCSSLDDSRVMNILKKKRKVKL